MPYAGMVAQRHSRGLKELAFSPLQRAVFRIYEKEAFNLVWWPLYTRFLAPAIPLKVNYVFNTFFHINEYSRLRLIWVKGRIA